MAGSVNKVILIGNLGRDPEVRQTQGGDDIVHLSIATSETWKDKNTNERRERTEWHRVVIFNDNLGKVAKQYLKKGAKVYLEGTIQTRKWTDQAGQEKYTTEVVIPRFRGELTMLDGNGHARSPSENDYGTTSTRENPSRSNAGGFGGGGGSGFGGGGFSAGVGHPGMPDDEIPFFRPDR